jgi:negative regulator of replication initiation
MAAQLLRSLFPVDFSNQCMLAARHVKTWVDRFSAILSTLHVVDPKAFGHDSLSTLTSPMWLQSALQI